MTTILRFQSADLLQCRFAVSPLGEVTDALRFLGRAARHTTPGADGYHLPWQRQVRPLLADLGIGPLLAVTGIDGYQPDFLNPVPDSPFAEIGTEIDRVRAAPSNRVAAEMARTGVDGLATKNFDSGRDVPASWPPDQDGPDEPCWTAGTKT